MADRRHQAEASMIEAVEQLGAEGLDLGWINGLTNGCHGSSLMTAVDGKRSQKAGVIIMASPDISAVAGLKSSSVRGVRGNDLLLRL